MPAVSLSRRIDQSLCFYTEGRYADLCVELLAPTGAVFLRAGGVWDRVCRRYDPKREPTDVVQIKLTPAQMPAAQRFKTWIEAYDRGDATRDGLLNFVDRRRGGKTFFAIALIFFFCVRYPRTKGAQTVTWIVIPTFPQRNEILITMAKLLPSSWFLDERVTWRQSDKVWIFATGAELWIKSADNPNVLKAGGVACVVINEAQQVDRKTIAHCTGANLDNGGLTVLAMNPPDNTKGLWAEDLHDAIGGVNDDGSPLLPFASEVSFPPQLNPHTDQAARKRFTQLLEVLDPKQAQRDGDVGDDIWARVKDRCYPRYNRHSHLKPLPTGWQDATAQCNALTFYLHRDKPRHFGAGMDFQLHPYCAAVRAKAFLAPPNNEFNLAPGTFVYWIVDDCTNDPSRGQFWTEEELCIQAKAQGWIPDDILVIADGTGDRQGSSMAQRGTEHDQATNSFPLVRSQGFEIHAPIEREERHVTKGGSTDWRTYRNNPRVRVRLNALNELFRTRRLFIAPSAALTAEAFRKCQLRRGHPYGWGAHLTDAACYLIWTWETKRLESAGRA